MSPKDNMLACIRQEPHERIPNFVFDITFGCSVAGIPVCDVFSNGYDAEKAAECITATHRLLKNDSCTASLRNMDVRIFGAEIRLSPDSPPITVRPAFKDPLALYDHSPSEADCEILRDMTHGYEIIRKKNPDLSLGGFIPSPFSVASNLRGLEPWLMDIMLEPDYTNDLLNFTKEVSSIFAGTILQRGEPDFALMTGAFDNPDLIGIETMGVLCIPGIISQSKIAKDNGLNLVYHPHCSFTEECNRGALDLYLKADVDCIYYGENNDHKILRHLAEDRCSLMGGIDTSSSIYLGPTERAIGDAKRVVDEMRGSHYIFTFSCSIDYGLDKERVAATMNWVSKNGSIG